MRRPYDIDYAAGIGRPLNPSSLSGVNVYVNSRQHSIALQDIPEWYEIGARCFKCGHAGLLDRWELARKYGAKRMIITLERQLVCTKCENRKANDFVMAKVHRNW